MKGQSLAAPHYNITPDMGRQVGINLFHSFSEFSVRGGQRATFTGPSNVGNIITRVTGNQASHIDGTIESSIGGADFYFVNPNGVIFEPHAAVNVGGAFVVSTADFVRLGADGRFSAVDTSDQLLSCSPPSAFGFLRPRPAAVEVVAAGNQITHLKVNDGRALSIISGDVSIEGGDLRAYHGRVTVVSVGSPGEVVVNAADTTVQPADAVDTGSFQRMGNVTFTGAQVLVSGMRTGQTEQRRSGSIVIRGGQLAVQGDSVFGKSLFQATNYSSLAGGAIDIRLTEQFSLTLAQIGSATDAAGAAGDITIDAPRVSIDALGQIQASTLGPGDGGNIHVVADEMAIDNQQISGQEFTGIKSASLSTLQGAGPAGRIELRISGALSLVGGGEVTAETGGPGRGGDIDVEARELRIAQSGSILSSSLGEGLTAGAGGSVTVRAASLLIDAANSLATNKPAGIFAETKSGSPSGAGGDIRVEVNSLSVQNGGTISATTFGPAPGGRVTLAVADALRVLDGANIAAQSDGAGRSGTIDIAAHYVLIDGRRGDRPAAITASTGDVTADAGNITVRAVEAIDLFSGQITAHASGDGGNINLRAGQRVHLIDSLVTGQTDGKGGEITIDPVFVVLDHSIINGLSGINKSPVRVAIHSDFFFASDSQILTNTPIDFPETDIAGSLVQFSVSLAGEAARLRNVCAAQLEGDFSSFIQLGRGGVPIEPANWLPSVEIRGGFNPP